MKRITAQDLYNVIRCAHRVFLDANGDPTEKSEVSSFVKLLWELGLQTERDYLATIGEAPVSDVSHLGVEEASRETVYLMSQGVPLIYQGCLADGRYVGRPDLLVKRIGASSRFGPFLYEPIDVKAGKGWEERHGIPTKFKMHYAFQVLFYWMLLERIQGTRLPIGRIINVRKQVEAFKASEFETAFQDALDHVAKLVGGEETSEPVLGSHCQMCPWYHRCRQWVEDHDDPTGLFFVGRQKFHMKQVGLHTIQDIAAMDVSEFLVPPKKIPKMGKVTLTRMKERARVKLTGKPELRQGYAFPTQPCEIYFDIEDDPTQDLTYLFGLLIRDEGAPQSTFRYFLARGPEEEEQTVRAFWEFLRGLGGAVLYVYSHKERTTLTHLRDRYDLDAAVLDSYKTKEFDLYRDLVVEYSDWPSHSYGIKLLGRFGSF